ncbi:hypothetical protein [Streptomyces sp. NBC_00083]|uniref:hypothetical protein n=1 Tax=Streptomyces sp. NBC_00083 TaxID=2975647 RepID=UPI00224FD37F|nr:hypothetical protein [Streptomyces sp. NBC_00083]MCX5382626.1 hypothetical protein [Streptomyces sp. NBC_00083]
MIRTAVAVGAAALGVAAVLVALSGCGARSGLVEGDRAYEVPLQPRPQQLWPAWYESDARRNGVMGSGRPEPRAPLDGAPRVPKEGLRALDPKAVLAADPAAKGLTRLPLIGHPGRPGIRPPVLHDLTGHDGAPELILSADLENRRTVVIVYTARDGKVVPILYTSGSRLAVETVGADLVTRGAADDGAQQTVRYRWDGTRMSPVSDDKTYRNMDPPAPGCPGRAAGPRERS